MDLEDIAYFARQAETVDDLRRLDLLLKSTLTLVDNKKSDAADVDP